MTSYNQLHIIENYDKLYFNSNIKSIKNYTFRFYHYQVVIEMIDNFNINNVDNIDKILFEYIPTCYEYYIKKYDKKFIIDYYTD